MWRRAQGPQLRAIIGEGALTGEEKERREGAKGAKEEKRKGKKKAKPKPKPKEVEKEKPKEKEVEKQDEIVEELVPVAEGPDDQDDVDETYKEEL